MFNFLKKNIWYFVAGLIILEIASCVYNSIDFTFGLIGAFLIITVFSVLIFFLNCKLIKKGFISDRDVFVLFCCLLLSLCFCVISFIRKNEGFTFVSMAAGLSSLPQFILVKLFDIKLYWWINISVNLYYNIVSLKFSFSFSIKIWCGRRVL